MTTIAWDGETLSADTQSITGYAIDQAPTQKIFKKSGKYFAIAGDYAQGLAIMDWILGGDRPELQKPEYEVMVIDGGEAMVYADQLLPYSVLPPIAFGTGRDFALGAMLSGKTAAQAVEIASRLDPNTGGKVKSFKCSGK